MTESEQQQYLADSWCEINGGGIVTPDQVKAILAIEKQVREEDTLRAEKPKE